jgi:hemoglobin-like flavoprotein
MSQTPQMTLSAKQKRLIRESFESVREYENSVLVLFYGRLFEIAPEARALFRIDIREQSAKLMETLRILIDTLDRFEQLLPHLAELGRKHLTYGVQPYLYERLRAALSWALGQALGAEFDRVTRAAWDTLLTTVSAVMLEGAASQAEIPAGPIRKQFEYRGCGQLHAELAFGRHRSRHPARHLGGGRLFGHRPGGILPPSHEWRLVFHGNRQWRPPRNSDRLNGHRPISVPGRRI